MKKPILIATALLSVCLSQACYGEKVFVRNRPFPQVTRGVQGSVMAELPALCQALELSLRQDGQQWIIAPAASPTDPSQEAPAPGGSQPGVYFGNQEVPGVDLSGPTPMVDLQAFIKIVGGKFSRNPAMQSIDVFPAPTPCKAGAARRAVAGNDFRLVVFNSGDKPPSQLGVLAPKVAKVVPLSSVYVDIAKSESPAYQQYSAYLEMGSLPFAVLVTPAGRAISTWRGMPKPEQVSVKAKDYLARRKAVNGEPVPTTVVEEIGG